MAVLFEVGDDAQGAALRGFGAGVYAQFGADGGLVDLLIDAVVHHLLLLKPFGAFFGGAMQVDLYEVGDVFAGVLTRSLVGGNGSSDGDHAITGQ